ncbi:MAG: type II secretion system F family protein [Verrucomicrobiae bacterium]|nr:type II secretion system F family protein [Verrucomicrobiae bacterium]
MTSFRYQAVQLDGAPVQGVIEAPDRKAALQLLSQRGVFPSRLESVGGPAPNPATLPATPPAPRHTAQSAPTARAAPVSPGPAPASPPATFGSRIRRKDITEFTREMSALLGAAIPIPQALDSLGEEEANPLLRGIVLSLAEAVRKGTSLSAALDEHPRHFGRLYISMVRVGEEAGQLPKVMADLASLLEHEDEVRSEVVTAVAYPAFVLGFGVFTVVLLMTVVLPRLFSMLQEMLPVLPLPTLVLLRISEVLHHHWPWLLIALGGAAFGARRYFSTDRGLLLLDRAKLRLPVVGAVFRSAALGRFARTLGTLARSGVSLLPALRIVEDTIGNRVLAAQIARVAEETRGGDSLAAPLRKLGVFPRGIVQMIEVGEETGRLDEMLLKVAEIEERHMRARIKTLISLLAPALILVVGVLVGFMVIALLLPIFRMSRAIQ